MKLSLNWLRDFVDIEDLSPYELSSKLTMGAFEVEEVKELGSNLKEPILIGKILDIQKHPDADKLSVTTVTTDGKNSYQIVCGAKNIEIGQLVPVSLPGAMVINRKDGSTLEIKKASLRGVESSGMLCSSGELGVEIGDGEGILIFPENTPLGKKTIDYLALKDYMLEVGSRSNRGDALSVFGLSKEIAAITKKNKKKLMFNEPKFDSSVKIVESKIENTNDTYVFYTATIENVEIGESPYWLQGLLRSVGIRSINNIVDITNYINISFGQPMHAYDKAKINGSLISRQARNGESLITLDGKERKLKEGILVIADNNGPVGIAGIMGGESTEVSTSTNSIVLEAASFNSARVRKGSREIGLTTEASKRFERGVDSNFTYNALLKAIELTQSLAKPKTKETKIGKIFQAGKPINKELKITLSRKEIKRVLNIDLKLDEVTNLLEPLDFKCKVLNQDLEVSIPTSRQGDITREIDLIEEVARLYGYDNIPTTPPVATLCPGKQEDFTEEIKDHFIAAGFSETYMSSLIGERILSYKDFNFCSEAGIEMLNPLSREHCVLRQALIPGLLEALQLNQNYKSHDVKLFEIGKVFYKKNSKPASDKDTGVYEKLRLGGVISGNTVSWHSSKNIASSNTEKLFFCVKGVIENLFLKLSSKKANFIKLKSNFLHPGYSLSLSIENKDFGALGVLHPSLEKNMGLINQTIVFELELDPLIEIIKNKEIKFKKISTQPIVERDITIDVPRIHTASTVMGEIEKVVSKFVIKIDLVNIYDLNSEVRSLSFRLRMQDPDQTLTTKQIESEVEKIINNLTSSLNAQFRA